MRIPSRIALGIAVAVLLTSALPAAGYTQRSAAMRYQFVKLTPCPSTGDVMAACPGYVVDHVIPLCADGADGPGNMQWQTIEQAKEKDKEEKRFCVAVRSKARADTKPGPAQGKQSPEFTCGAKRKCGEMSSCAEARFYLTECGAKQLDRDHDGIPCESLCGDR